MRQRRTHFTGLKVLTLFAAVMALTGCAGNSALHPSRWHLPWHKSAPAAPVPVTELGVEADGSHPLPTVMQFWNRNTLRVDLGSASASGSFILRPSKVNGWPMRIEIAVRPGSLTQLEVHGEKRVVFNVAQSPAADGGLQLLELGAGVYSAQTPALTVSWE
jgi:hypothetical protein